MITLKVPVTLNDHLRGNRNAPITLIEYADYQCPESRHAHYLIDRVRDHFGKQLRFVFRNFCLSDIHPLAEIAAETAEFAAVHNTFWEMHDLIYDNQEHLNMEMLFELAKRLKLPVNELKDAFISRPFLTRIRADLLGGVECGISKTPTIFINNRLYDKTIEYDELVKAIELQIPLKQK